MSNKNTGNSNVEQNSETANREVTKTLEAIASGTTREEISEIVNSAVDRLLDGIKTMFEKPQEQKSETVVKDYKPKIKEKKEVKRKK
jgi:hypothetical protein